MAVDSFLSAAFLYAFVFKAKAPGPRALPLPVAPFNGVQGGGYIAVHLPAGYEKRSGFLSGLWRRAGSPPAMRMCVIRPAMLYALLTLCATSHSSSGALAYSGMA